MKVFRKEVNDFIRIAETLLSSASLKTPLTKEECHVVEFYVNALAGHCSRLGHSKVEDNETCPVS